MSPTRYLSSSRGPSEPKIQLNRCAHTRRGMGKRMRTKRKNTENHVCVVSLVRSELDFDWVARKCWSFFRRRFSLEWLFRVAVILPNFSFCFVFVWWLLWEAVNNDTHSYTPTKKMVIKRKTISSMRKQNLNTKTFEVNDIRFGARVGNESEKKK